MLNSTQVRSALISIGKSSFYLAMLSAVFLMLPLRSYSQPPESSDKQYAVIGYYAGNASQVSRIKAKQLSHIIYSFCGLRGNKLYLGDTLTVKRLTALKKQNPKLKIQLALGGWGGCKTCSQVFSSEKGRIEFALSVRRACERLKTDGIDLDWEYPAVKGYPGHLYQAVDKENFTALVLQLRQTLGSKYEISFAAGAFTEYLENSIDWPAVMKAVDRVNLMTYDLVNGYSPVTGHHTALYSTPSQVESTDHAVNFLLCQGVPASKIVIGAAFYARVWQDAGNINNGLHQPARPKATVGISIVDASCSEKQGFKHLWDDMAQAPYRYHPGKKIFVTFDDQRSVKLKTQYVVDKKLGGMMFWQIRLDRTREPLTEVITQVFREATLRK